jgi:hypothetical protein
MSVQRPRARKEGLLVRDIGDEVVVYELESHRGHCLNRTAALVWHACDGRRTVAAITGQVGRELGAPADEDLVRYTLRRLSDARLLDPGIQEAATTLTRRQIARRMGQAALLPVVISLLAPKPSEAATCEAGCAACDCTGVPNLPVTSCWNGTDCSSYICCNGSCVPAGPC